VELGTSWSRLKFVDIATVLCSPRNCCSCFADYIRGRVEYKNGPFLVWNGPEVVAMRFAARTWTQLLGRGSVTRQGQIWTITKAPNTSLVLADTRSTERFTSALCSFLHDGFGFDTNIVHEGRYVTERNGKRKVKYSKCTDVDDRIKRSWEKDVWRHRREFSGTGRGPVTNCLHHCNKTYSVVETGEILNHLNDWLNAAF